MKNGVAYKKKRVNRNLQDLWRSKIRLVPRMRIQDFH